MALAKEGRSVWGGLGRYRVWGIAFGPSSTYLHWGMYVEARQVHVQGRRNLASEAQGAIILG